MNRRRFSASGTPRAAVWIPICSLLFHGCYPRPGDPVGLPDPPDPFLRAPYVQSVSDSAAWVLWLASPEAADSVWYRLPEVDSGWTAAKPEDHRGGTRRARLGGLAQAAWVEYMVSAGGTHSGPHRFRTAPRWPAPPGSDREDVRVLLFGDSGWGGDAQLDLARQMARFEWDLAIHVGDIAYDDGTQEEFTRRHFRVYEPVLASTPMYPAVGNHDVRADGGLAYDGAFRWPRSDAGARYYAFRWADILFISIDTSSEGPDAEGLRDRRGRQYAWIEGTLRAGSTDGSLRWIIVFQHHPLYSHAIGISGHGRETSLRRNLLPLYERYGVDLVASGHDHHYERSRPLRGGKVVPPGCGPVHILTGGGGASRYARDIRPSSLAAIVERVYEYVDLRVGAEAIRGRAVGRDGSVIDSFVVRPFDAAREGTPECAG